MKMAQKNNALLCCQKYILFLISKFVSSCSIIPVPSWLESQLIYTDKKLRIKYSSNRFQTYMTDIHDRQVYLFSRLIGPWSWV